MGKTKKEKNIQESIDNSFKKVFLEIIVLTLLENKSMYSYELSCEIQKILDYKAPVPYLYPLVYRLKDGGFIEETQKSVSEDNRIRIYYHTTKLGLEYLGEQKRAFHRTLDIVATFISE